MHLSDFYHYYLIKRSGLFDSRFYLRKNLDVKREGMNPIWHFVRFGWREKRNPSEYFDVGYYLNQNPDVQKSGLNPLIHFILHGKLEGRQPLPNNEKHLSSQLPCRHQETISIIIPTKNAGDDFEILMKAINYQTGFSKIEVVVVDSGSQDETVKIAKKFNAKVIKIPPEKFSHSFARNLGASKASGDYLLFTVQDALPPSSIWLCTLMSKLKELSVSAVSCAEQTRDDADLFYRVISWNHYEFLEVNGADRILSMPDDPNYLSLRKNGQLSDLACLIQAKLFAKYQYRCSYAEDLDLGLRLIKDGYNLAFLNSPRIIHSHNRPAYYFLKRAFVDNLTLSDIFTDFEIPKVNFRSAAHDILFIFHFLCFHVFEEISKLSYPIILEEFEKSMFRIVNSASTFHYPQAFNYDENKYITQDLSNFLDILLDVAGYDKDGIKYDGKLSASLNAFLYSTIQYLKVSYDNIDGKLAEEIKHCLTKGAANISGALLAYASLNQTSDKSDQITSVYSLLRENV